MTLDLGDGGPSPSTNLATSSIHAEFSAQAYGDGVRVYASLVSEFFDENLNLGPTDSLTASEDDAAPVPLTLEQEDASPVLHYTANLPQNVGATSVVIDFSRTANAAAAQSAPHSVVVVPPSFEIISTPPDAVPVGTPLPISISPPPVPLAGVAAEAWSLAVVSGSCANSIAAAFPLAIAVGPDGRATLDTSFLANASLPCDVTLQVRHETAGTIDPAFAHVSAEASAEPEASTYPVADDAGVALDPLAWSSFLGLQARSFAVHVVAPQ